MKARVKRDKKFIGAAIGAVANIAGGIVGAVKKKKLAKQQEAEMERQQFAQNAVDASQQAAAMSSSYADQQYVDDYKSKIALKNGGKVKTKDRIQVAKKYAMGGRSKKLFGMNNKQMATANNVVSMFDTIGTAATNIATGGQSNIKPVTNYADTVTANNLEKNKEIARQAELARTGKSNQPVMKCGGRKKKAFGDIIGEVGGAASGLSGLVTSLTGPKQKVQQAATPKTGYAYSAPKTGLVQNSYQTDANGNPVNSTTSNGVVGTLDMSNNQYKDRLMTAKMGTRKRRK